MEEEMAPEPRQVHPKYQCLLDFPYESLPPAAAFMMSTFLSCYDPRQPPERMAQNCQMQFSHQANGGGGGTAGVAHRRVLTHTEGRVIGHNLVEKHFMDVDNEDRIKQKDAGGYELPTQPTSDDRFDYILQREWSRLDIPPQDSFLPDLVTTSPRKETNTAPNVAGSTPVATANSSDSEMTELQNPIAIDLAPLEVPQVATQAPDLPTDLQTQTLPVTITDQTVVGAIIPPPPMPPQDQISTYHNPAVLIVDDDDIHLPTLSQPRPPWQQALKLFPLNPCWPHLELARLMSRSQRSADELIR